MIEPEEPNEDYFNEDEEIEFIRCSSCDGHDACEDFGCAFECGCGHLVKKDPSFDWD